MLAANHQATFTVERPDGTKSRVRADQLLFNAALRYMQDHPRAQPKECTCTTPHDALLCTFVHFRRVYSIQLRDGSSRLCERDEIRPGAALDFLDTHRMANGKECTNKRAHDAAACAYIHFTEAPGGRTRSVPSSSSSLCSNDSTVQSRQAGHTASRNFSGEQQVQVPVGYVLAGEQLLAETELDETQGKQRAIAEFGRRGKVCKYSPCGHGSMCNFLHLRRNSAAGPAASSANTEERASTAQPLERQRRVTFAGDAERPAPRPSRAGAAVTPSGVATLDCLICAYSDLHYVTIIVFYTKRSTFGAFS
jgi:hypothetical protein